MKFDQIMEKVEIKNSGSIYEYLFLNVDEESKIEYSNGNKFWRRNYKRHRTDGPASERSDGNKFWKLNDKLHRTDGPAMEWADGDKEWFLNGNRHRADGPAIEYSNGSKYWWLHGKEYSEEDFNEKVKNEI